jgi:hypothetical protein
MALSGAEKHLVYEVLGIPNATSVLNINGDYGTGSRFQNMAITTAKTEIDAPDAPDGVEHGVDVGHEATGQHGQPGGRARPRQDPGADPGSGEADRPGVCGSHRQS